MNAQKLLIISFLLMILGAALSSRMGSGPAEIMTKNESELLLQEVRYIASSAVIYWRKPAQVGGGKRSFIGITDVTSFGIEPINGQRVHTISAVKNKEFTLTTVGLINGIKIVSILTNQGIKGTPTMILPLNK